MQQPSPAELLQAAVDRAAWVQYNKEREAFLEELKRGRYTNSVHGTRTRARAGCKCDLCNEANAAYMREYRLRKGITKQPREKGRNFTHGTEYGYQHCKPRCAACFEAGQRHNAKYRLRRKQLRGVQDSEES